MKITIDSRGRPNLVDAWNFTEFVVIVSPATGEPEMGSALRALGRPTADLSHVYVERHWLLQQLPTQLRDAQWRKEFDDMIEFAALRGWVDAEGRVRAHVSMESASRPQLPSSTRHSG